MREQEGLRVVDAVALAAVVVLGCAGPMVVAAVALRAGPPGTTVLVALITFALAMAAGVSAAEPFVRRGGRTAYGEGTLLARPAGRAAAEPALGPGPGPRRRPGPGVTGGGDPVGEPGRCFGCVRLQEVTDVGVLARGGVQVPLRVCGDCLSHLALWHAAEAARSEAGRAAPEPQLVW